MAMYVRVYVFERLTVAVIHLPRDGILGHRGPEERVDADILLRLPLQQKRIHTSYIHTYIYTEITHRFIRIYIQYTRQRQLTFDLM